MLWTDQVRCYADESCALFHSLEGYTVAVNKKFTFRIRTTIVVRTENLRSRSMQFLRSTIADSAIQGPASSKSFRLVGGVSPVIDRVAAVSPVL